MDNKFKVNRLLVRTGLLTCLRIQECFKVIEENYLYVFDSYELKREEEKISP